MSNECYAILIPALKASAENMGEELNVTDSDSAANTGRVLLHETEVITQKDFQEGFKNYAQSDAAVDLSWKRSCNMGNFVLHGHGKID